MHDQNPRISVVIPTYNRANLISRAIQSVLDQTYKDLEIIVVDDGSKDNTAEIINKFKDERIRYIRHEKNKGASAARNTGIKASKGKFVAFQDSDDEWFHDKLEQQIKAFDSTSSKVGVVYSGFYRLEGDRKIYIPGDHIAQKEGNIHEELLRDNFVGTPTVLVKKECFENTKYFDEELPALEDWELWIELSKHYLFKYINKPLLCSYSTPNSVNLNQKNMLKASEIILATHLNDFSKNKKILSYHYYRIAVELFSNNDFENGRIYIINAAKANHFNIKAIFCLLILPFGQSTFIKIKQIYQKLSHQE